MKFLYVLGVLPDAVLVPAGYVGGGHISIPPGKMQTIHRIGRIRDRGKCAANSRFLPCTTGLSTKDVTGFAELVASAYCLWPAMC